MSSAEEDGGSWDLTSDPHVTRTTSTRLGRATSNSHFADDESSESSTAGFSDGCGIQGTFPSAERLRVRWAAPLKNVGVPNGGDGRRRVGVRETQAEMTCVILGKGKSGSNGAEGIVMNIECKGTCKGVWFPGVATMLGMDVGLEAKGSDVTWFSESEPKWTVGGSLGYTGFDMGGSSQERSDQRKTESGPQIHLSPSTPPKPGLVSRHNSNSSTASLLRAPLPVQPVQDYSFEGSVASSAPSGTLYSISSLLPSDPNLGGADSTPINCPLPDALDPLPGAPVTIHINMNDLPPPSNNVFTFTISGSILVTPRSRSYSLNSRTSPTYSDVETDPDPIVLPRFTVLAADTETTTFLLRSDAPQATLEVYNSSGDIRDAQTRKTVLQKGGATRCGSDGARIALRSIRPFFVKPEPALEGVGDNGRSPQTRARTTSHVASPKSGKMTDAPSSKPKRHGRLMIPYVEATVTPLVSGHPGAFPDAHAVRLCLPTPCDGSEWLELVFALPVSDAKVDSPATAIEESLIPPPRLNIASASVDGVPVRFESSANIDRHQVAEEHGWEELISCFKIHNAGRSGGNLVIDYVVTTDHLGERRRAGGRKRKRKGVDGVQLDVLLPAFALPVGRLEVKIETPSGGFFLFISPILTDTLTEVPQTSACLRCNRISHINTTIEDCCSTRWKNRSTLDYHCSCTFLTRYRPWFPRLSESPPN